MVILMDVSGDQAMSSSSPVNLSGQLAQGSPSPFQTQASVDGDEHEDEQSKSSNQTIVTMQQASQQQATGEQAASDEQQQQQQEEQRMIVSGGSSFEEDDEKRLMMSVDNDEEAEQTTKGVSLKLEQEELEARLNQAKSSRFNVGQRHHQQGQQNVESSLVAQMRDIVEGTQSGAGGSSSARRTAAGQQQQRRLEDKENNKSGEQAGEQTKPKSSSDSLNNQNDNGHNRGSMDSASQKRTRHSSRVHCRHHGHHHHHPHHHHHHHNAHHHHRHRQSLSGSSLPGQVEGGASTEPAELLAGKSTAAHLQHHSHHHHHLPHHRHHNHHHHHHGYRHRHSNAGHRQAHHHQHQHGHHAHHHHHHHHHHHQQDQSKRAVSERNSIQRLSLAMIETADHDKSEGQSRPEMTAAAGAASGPVGTKAIESNDSSMSSVSCSVQKQPAQNPSQSQPESKSSGSPPSDEQSAAAAATNVATGQQGDNTETQMDPSKEPLDGQHNPNHHHNHHHHHHHHPRHHHHTSHQHNCHHRSNKRRLVLDTAGSGDKSNQVTASQQDDMTTPVNEPLVQQVKRDPLKDLASGINTAVGDGELRNDDKTNRHHHHHHNNNNRHHHHHHCAHRHQARANGQLLADEHQTSPPGGDAQQSSPGKSSHLHQHHCVHHRHRYHQHHHCGRQQQQAHKSRQKSVSQTNVAQRGDELAAVAAAGGEQTADGKSKSSETEPPRESNELVQASDEVVKMETSPPPSQLLSDADARRRSAVGVQQAAASAELATSQPVSRSALPTSINNESEGRETELGDVNETTRREATNKVNQEANCAAPRDQENFQSGESDAGNDPRGGQQQQEANKLTRQMSSQSSRRSQKEEVPGGGADDLNGRNQSEHLREFAELALQPATINQRPDEPRQANLVASNLNHVSNWNKQNWFSLSTRDAANRAIEKPKASQGPPSSPVNTNYPSLSNVPLDEIRSWSESFDKLMRCSDGRKVFQDFLRCEYSEENILFWSACEELKKERDSKNIAAKARDIYEDYISILSSKEVSLDSRVRDIINNNIKKPTSNIFDEAQLQIYTLMHRDSYPRFINSIMYKKLAQIPVSNSRKSSS